MNHCCSLAALLALTLASFQIQISAQSWQPVTNGLPPNARVQAIAGDHTRIYAGIGSPLNAIGIYVSTDNGNSWNKTADGPSGPIYADGNALLVTSNVIIASRLVFGECFRSTDQGASWQLVSGIPSDGGVVSLDWDGTNFFAQVLSGNGAYGPYRSTDGGATWTPIYSGLTGIPQKIGVLNGRLFSTQVQSGLWASSNQGSTWSKILPEIVANNFPPCRMTTYNGKLFLGVSGNADPSVISVAGGANTWQSAAAGLPSSFNEGDFTSSSGAVFVGGQNGSNPSVWQSLDGVTWQELPTTGLNNAPASITPVSALWAHGNSLFASTFALSGTNGFYRLTLESGKVNLPPTATNQPVSATVGTGATATFSVGVIGQGPISYQWRSNGVNLVGATAPTLTLNNVTTNFSASYSAIFWNAYGTNSTTNAVLTVLPTSPGSVDFNFTSAPMGSEFSGFIFGGNINAVAVQPDGRILAAGNFNRVGGVAGSPFPAGGILGSNIVRYLADGSLDLSFQLTNGANNAIKTLALQTDGKILIGGQFTAYKGVTRNRLARLNPDGTLDTNFLATASGFNGDVNAIAIQPDGKILVGGAFTTVNGTNRASLARLLDNGDYDTNFLNGLTGPASTVLAVQWRSNRIYVAGGFNTFNGSARGRIARLLESGALDSSFDPGTGFNSDVYTLAVQTDGKIIAGGLFSSFRGTNTATRLARLTDTGAFDHAFNGGVNQLVTKTLLQPDGKLIIGGNFTTASATNRVRIARFNTDGSLDLTFDPAAGPSAQVNDLALQADGQLVIGGAFTTVNNLPRYLLARLFAAPLTTPPPVLNYLVVGANLQFSWTGNFVLQSNNVPTGPGWTTLPGPSPLIIPTSSGPGAFFRLAPAP